MLCDFRKALMKSVVFEQIRGFVFYFGWEKKLLLINHLANATIVIWLNFHLCSIYLNGMNSSEQKLRVWLFTTNFTRSSDDSVIQRNRFHFYNSPDVYTNNHGSLITFQNAMLVIIKCLWMFLHSGNVNQAHAVQKVSELCVKSIQMHTIEMKCKKIHVHFQTWCMYTSILDLFWTRSHFHMEKRALSLKIWLSRFKFETKY